MDTSKVMFGTVAPQFIVPDVVETAEYYRDVYGFKIVSYFQDPPVHAIVQKGHSEVFFAQSQQGATQSNRRLKPLGIDAYFYIKGLDAYHEQLLANGAKILESPVERVYQMREVEVEDCNGFVLVFGEDTSKGAKRG